MTDYNADSIQIVSDIEHVRLRKGMYIGESYNPNHLFSEIFDNALDEDMSGFSNKPMEITIDRRCNSYIIRDYGRGLPQGDKVLEDGSKKNVIEILFTELKSGGKFDNNSYKISGGLHGMGDCIVNALSSSLQVISYRKDKIEKHNFKYGKEIDVSVRPNESKEPSGTMVKFIPDEEMFDSDRISVDFITNRCKIASSFGYKSELRIIHNDDVIEKINTESSIHDLIVEDDKFSEYLFFEGNAEDKSTGESIKYAIWYTNDTSCRNKSYTNLLPNSQGGTHVNIFYNAFEDAWSRLKISDILPKDLYLGLRFVVSAFIQDTDFSSQTKDKLTVNKKNLNKFIKPLSDSIYKNLISKDNEDIIKGLIKRFQEHRASQNKLLAKKEIKDLIYISESSTDGKVRRKSVVTKLKECTSRTREDTEMHIVEGDSAAYPLVQNRDILTQAILPIRGKILNVTKHDLKRAFNNAEIVSIINAAGTGIFDECDVTKSRYERYIIDTDADADGLAIQSTVTAVFVNFLPNIVKAGMLYVSIPALYGWYEKDEFKFSNNFEDIPREKVYKHEFQRYKGLGQLNPNEVSDMLLDKNKRTIVRVQYPDDLDRFNEILSSASAKYDILCELGLIEYID